MKPFLIFLLALGTIDLAACGRDKSAEQKGGFRDWVKNPERRDEAAEHFAAREAVTVPENIPPDEIQKLVDQLFEQDDDDFTLETLEKLGPKATPALIAALESERAFAMKFPEGGHALDAQSPFERICDLLEETVPPEAAKPLARYAGHADDHFRTYAARTLGNIATEDCIAPMLKLLDDEDEYVRSFAMMGIQRGLKMKPDNKPFFRAMVPALEALLDRPDTSISDEAPQLLLTIDRERMIPLFLSDNSLTLSNRHLHYVLRALSEAGVPVPHDRLLPLLARLEPLVDKYPHEYQFAAALMAYAHHPDAQTEAFLQARVGSKNEDVAEAAAAGLGILSGVTDPYGVVTELLKAKGWSKLTTAQQHYFAVLVYDGEVRNGGHAQYFVNSSGDHYEAALQGLSAIGATERAAILREAVQLFGAGGPSTKTRKRHEQLSGFTTEQDEQLDALDSKYYAGKESTDAMLTLYALKHKADFSPKK